MTALTMPCIGYPGCGHEVEWTGEWADGEAVGGTGAWVHRLDDGGLVTDEVPLMTGTPDGFADNDEYLDNVGCASCDGARPDAQTCEMTLGGCEHGCECVVSKISSCDWTDGMWACEAHTPSHRGCRECDPIMPWEN